MSAILVLLASFNLSFGQSYHQGAKLDNMNRMNGILDAINGYQKDCGQYPASLANLVEQPEAGSCSNWSGPYLRALPKDSWGQDYVYSQEGSQFRLLSYGPDRREGGRKYSDIAVTGPNDSMRGVAESN